MLSTVEISRKVKEITTTILDSNYIENKELAIYETKLAHERRIKTIDEKDIIENQEKLDELKLVISNAPADRKIISEKINAISDLFDKTSQEIKKLNEALTEVNDSLAIHNQTLKNLEHEIKIGASDSENQKKLEDLKQKHIKAQEKRNQDKQLIEKRIFNLEQKFIEVKNNKNNLIEEEKKLSDIYFSQEYEKLISEKTKLNLEKKELNTWLSEYIESPFSLHIQSIRGPLNEARINLFKRITMFKDINKSKVVKPPLSKEAEYTAHLENERLIKQINENLPIIKKMISDRKAELEKMELRNDLIDFKKNPSWKKSQIIAELKREFDSSFPLPIKANCILLRLKAIHESLPPENKKNIEALLIQEKETKIALEEYLHIKSNTELNPDEPLEPKLEEKQNVLLIRLLGSISSISKNWSPAVSASPSWRKAQEHSALFASTVDQMTHTDINLKLLKYVHKKRADPFFMEKIITLKSNKEEQKKKFQEDFKDIPYNELKSNLKRSNKIGLKKLINETKIVIKTKNLKKLLQNIDFIKKFHEQHGLVTLKISFVEELTLLNNFNFASKQLEYAKNNYLSCALLSNADIEKSEREKMVIKGITDVKTIARAINSAKKERSERLALYEKEFIVSYCHYKQTIQKCEEAYDRYRASKPSSVSSSLASPSRISLSHLQDYNEFYNQLNELKTVEDRANYLKGQLATLTELNATYPDLLMPFRKILTILKKDDKEADVKKLFSLPSANQLIDDNIKQIKEYEAKLVALKKPFSLFRKKEEIASLENKIKLAKIELEEICFILSRIIIKKILHSPVEKSILSSDEKKPGLTITSSGSSTAIVSEVSHSSESSSPVTARTMSTPTPKTGTIKTIAPVAPLATPIDSSSTVAVAPATSVLTSASVAPPGISVPLTPSAATIPITSPASPTRSAAIPVTSPASPTASPAIPVTRPTSLTAISAPAIPVTRPTSLTATSAPAIPVTSPASPPATIGIHSSSFLFTDALRALRTLLGRSDLSASRISQASEAFKALAILSQQSKNQSPPAQAMKKLEIFLATDLDSITLSTHKNKAAINSTFLRLLEDLELLKIIIQYDDLPNERQRATKLLEIFKILITHLSEQFKDTLDRKLIERHMGTLNGKTFFHSPSDTRHPHSPELETREKKELKR